MSQCFYFNERSTSKLFILLMIRRLPISTLFPCTTLVRSPQSGALGLAELGRCPRSSQSTLSPWPCGSPGRAPVPGGRGARGQPLRRGDDPLAREGRRGGERAEGGLAGRDRKGKPLNSRHANISDDVFCLEQKHP